MNHTTETRSTALQPPPKTTQHEPAHSAITDNDQSLQDTNTLEIINYVIFTYGDPLTMGLGAIGNLLGILVFTLTPLKVRPWSHVQAGICLVDLLYVTSCLVVYLAKRGESVYDTPSLCQVTTLTLMVSRSLQAWFVFISHFDRLNTHFNPAREGRKRRVYNTKFAILIVSLLVVAPSVHVLWSYEVRTMYGRKYCVPMTDDMQFHIIMRKIHLVGSLIIPMALTVGIDLFFMLKLALHCFCDVSDDDDDDADVGNLGVYTGYKVGNDSSFCSDNIVQLPLQEKKSDMCEHLLRNTADSCRQKPRKNNLSTIVENSVTSSGNHNKQSMNNNNNGHDARAGNGKVDNNTVQAGDKTGDKFSLLQRKYTCDRKQEVARYILTIAPEDDDCIEKDVGSNLTLNFDNNELQDKLSSSQTTLSPDFGSGRGNTHTTTHYTKTENNKRSPRSQRKPNRKKRSNGGNAKDSSLVSVYSSSMNATHNSVSYSHYHSYNYTSMVSNVSRSTVIPKDHMFVDDMTSSSVTAVVIGIVMCSLVLPSALVEGKILFLSEMPTQRPSALSIQKAILFESLVLFNSVYKLFLFVIVLKSFRQAFVWLLISCLPKRFMSSASICTFEFDDDNKSDSDNIDDV